MIYDSVSATCNSWSFHHDENSLAEDDNIDEVEHEEKKTQANTWAIALLLYSSE